MNDKKKILLIDDEEDFCFFVKGNLENTGFEVLTASSAKEGIDLAVAKKPDVILLDLVMPEVSGGDAAAVLFDHPETENIPIIFVTAMLTKKETGEKGLTKVGGRNFIAKPVTTNELVSAINTVLR
jgi:DNA-binding response OmpR family regulator